MPSKGMVKSLSFSVANKNKLVRENIEADLMRSAIGTFELDDVKLIVEELPSMSLLS